MCEWLMAASNAAQHDGALAREIIGCQCLVKGYGDTHARGMRSLHRILSSLPKLAAANAAKEVRKMREAALADESGRPLDELLATLLASAERSPIRTSGT